MKIFSGLKKKWLFCTPRWYSYGGMFESIFLAVNLARYYDREVLFFYPKNNFDRRLKHPGFLNRELMNIVVDGHLLTCGTFFQKIVTRWLEINRWIRLCSRSHFIARIIHFLIHRLRIEWVFPIRIGFSGLESSDQVSHLLDIPGPVDWEKVLGDPVFIDLTDRQKQQGEEILQQMGVPLDSPFVCVYVRDTGYESRRRVPNSGSTNADIEFFDSAISFLEVQGFYIIRVGDPTMTPFDRDSDRFIDYVHTEFYSEIMDLFLSRHCAFWLGTIGGGRVPPLAFGRPSVVVNGIYWERTGFCINPGDVYLAKHIYSTNEERFLCIREQLERMDQINETEDGRLRQDYIFVENSPHEILCAVKEFYQSEMVGDFEWDVEIQDKLHALKCCNVKKYLYNMNQNKWKTNNAEWFGRLRLHVSQKYLQNCWKQTDYLSKLSEHFNLHDNLKEFIYPN